MIGFGVALLFLTFWGAYFSASETAFFSLSNMKIKAYQTDVDPRKRLIARMLLQPRDLLVTVFILNTLVNISIQNVFSSMVGQEASWVLKVWVPLVFTLIIGEVIPKYLGLQNNVSLAYIVAPSLDFFQRLLKPVLQFMISITAPISRTLFFFFKKEKSLSREELQHVLKTSEEYGVLHPDEADLVWGYLELQEASVKEVMRPREDVEGFEISDPLNKLFSLFADKKLTEVPVYQKEIDNLLGMLSAKEAFLHRDIIESQGDLQKYLTRPFYIPENTPARLLLRRLDTRSQPSAMVVDEYGTTSGMITRTDLIDLLVGESDEELEKSALYTRSGQNEIIASGKLELSTFNELFDVELDSPNNMVTLGGWLIEQLGDIPKSGTKYKTDVFLFQILSAEPHRIRRVYVRKLSHINPKSKGSSP